MTKQRMRYAAEAHTHAGGGLPAGGTVGQLLRKNSSTAGDASWATVVDSWPYRGAWSGATSYVTGDVVQRTNCLYVAAAGSFNMDPAVTPSPASVGSLSGSGVNMGNIPTAQEFTTSSAIIAYGVRLYANFSSIPSGSTVQIRSGSPSGTILFSATTTANISTDLLVPFSTPGVLPAGTYWLCIGGGYAKGITEAGTTRSGVISAQGRMWYGAGWTNTSLETSYNIAFDLYEQASSPWSVLVSGVPYNLPLPNPVSAAGASSNTITATAWADIPGTSVTATLVVPAKMRLNFSFSAWLSMVAGSTSGDLRVDWTCVNGSGTTIRAEADSGWGAILYQSAAASGPTLVTSRASSVMLDLNPGTYTFTLRAYKTGGTGGTFACNYPRIDLFPVCWL